LLLVALPVFIYTKTGSGASTAALFVVELLVAVVVGPLAGRLVDRWDLRRTLICTNLAQAAALTPLLAVTADRLWPAYLVAVSQSCLTRINNPASLAIVPQLVVKDQLVAANAAMSSMRSLARLVGSPLGGIVVESAGLGGVIVADGVSFVAVAAATWFVRADTSVASRRAASLHVELPAEPVLFSADEVVPLAVDAPPAPAHLSARGRWALGVTLLLSGIAQGMFLVLFLSFVVDDLHGQGSEVGLVRGVQAVGGLLGSVIIARIASRIDPVRLLSMGLAGIGIISAVIWNGTSFTEHLAVYLILFVIVGVPAIAANVGAVSVMQQAVPADRLGRFGGQMEAVTAAGTAAGSLAVGGLLDRVERWTLFDAQSVIYLLAACCAAAIGTHSASRRVTSSAAGRSSWP
jgi:predicted MFS family arabinose efflux permease